MTDKPTHSASMVLCTSVIVRVKYPLRLFVCYIHPVTQQYEEKNCSKSKSMFNSLDSSTTCLKSTSVKIRPIFVTQRKPSCATTKWMLFTVSKDEWNTKEDSGKSLKNVLDILRYAKGTSRAKTMSNSEKVKPIALAITELH